MTSHTGVLQHSAGGCVVVGKRAAQIGLVQPLTGHAVEFCRLSQSGVSALRGLLGGVRHGILALV